VQDAYLMLAIAEGFGESPIPGLLRPDVDPEALLLSPPQPPVVPPRVTQRLRQKDLQAQARAMRQEAVSLGLQLLTPTDKDWPHRLSQQPLAPLVLFVKGDAKVLQCEPACAAVGSRTPTPYGIDAAKNLCAAMARSGTILWSGLARGIDGIAHTACLTANTPTVAVLAGSMDCIYPPEHEDLAKRIVAHGGCLISELPPRRRARRGHFVRRNRLLAAGPQAVLVIEGSLASGALHTARFATDCSTEVFAVPGPWQSERSQGCHRLIAEGAGIVESPESLLQSLGLVMNNAKTSLHLETSAQQQAILAHLSRGPRPTDLLQRECALEDAAFLRALFGLEQNGWIERLPGDLWRNVTA
jgi:DNA processing protein